MRTIQLILVIITMSPSCYGQDTIAPQASFRAALMQKMNNDQAEFKFNEQVQEQEVQQNLEAESPEFTKPESQLQEHQTKGIIQQTRLEENFNPKRLSGPSIFDSRIEIAQLRSGIASDVAIRAMSESVAMVVEKENLIMISPEKYQLNTAVTLQERYSLCDGEAFANQVVVGAGTAFVIGKDVMATAAHVFERPLDDYAIVFGYRVINSLGTAETSISIEDVFFPSKIVKKDIVSDFVTFTTDRQLNKTIIEWEKSSLLQKGNEIYMLGYPMGLPQKLAINADITDNMNHGYFYTSLDSFQGNSGSPVFNLKTHKLIGILVSGMVDYELRGDCYKSAVCRQPFCIGEKAVRAEMVFE